MMSYWAGSETGQSPGVWATSFTPLLLDIYELQVLYGVNTATRTGDTTYGFNSTAGSLYSFAKSKSPYYCIWDGGGKNTIDASGYSQNQVISLNPGSFSDIGGGSSNISIALGVIIQSAIGGAGNDLLKANNLNDFLDGGSGNDTLVGGEGFDSLFGGTGNDSITGGAGNDTLDGGTGNDTLSGGEGNDTLVASAGTDYLYGEGGIDTAQFQGSSAKYFFKGNITAGTISGPEGNDNLSSVEILSFVDGRKFFSADTTGAEVLRLYQAALGRAPDATGLSRWVDALEHGFALKTLAGGFLGAAEFTTRFAAAAGPDNGAYVEQLYNNVLHRASDAAGKASWVNGLTAASLNRSDVLVGFSESAENQSNTSAKVNSGIWVVDVSAAEVGRLYDTVLGRLPDVAGLSAWKLSMLSGQQNINQVANSFVSSGEFQARYGTLNDPNFINALYVNTLHRQPDSPGLTSWTNALTHGMARADVVLSFSESDEHITNTTMTLLSDGGMLFA
jgi:hypothetical protein